MSSKQSRPTFEIAEDKYPLSTKSISIRQSSPSSNDFEEHAIYKGYVEEKENSTEPRNFIIPAEIHPESPSNFLQTTEYSNKQYLEENYEFDFDESNECNIVEQEQETSTITETRHILSTEDTLFEIPIFTRYLYITTDAYNSLLKCLGIEPYILLPDEPIDREQIFFWIFELYYSGFREESIHFFEEIVEKIAEQYFQSGKSTPQSQNQKNKLYKLCKQWMDDFQIETDYSYITETDDYEATQLKSIQMQEGVLLAEMIEVMIYFIECCRNGYSPTHNIHIIVPYEDIKHLVELEDIIRPYQVLDYKCIYSSEKEHTDELPISRENIRKALYNGEWLYYCYWTPVWKKRIEKYGGMPDDETRQIVFSKHDGLDVQYSEDTRLYYLNIDPETREEMFYSKYGYEPDNNINIMNIIVG